MVPRVGNETLRPLGFGPCFGRKLQTKKLMMYSPGGPFIMVAPVVTSWAVAGQRMVFLHMYLQTRVTLKAFPVATPRGRSVSFPTRGTMVTYVTWDGIDVETDARKKTPITIQYANRYRKVHQSFKSITMTSSLTVAFGALNILWSHRDMKLINNNKDAHLRVRFSSNVWLLIKN